MVVGYSFDNKFCYSPLHWQQERERISGCILIFIFITACVITIVIPLILVNSDSQRIFKDGIPYILAQQATEQICYRTRFFFHKHNKC